MMDDAFARSRASRADQMREHALTEHAPFDALIERIRDCERVFDLTHVARSGADTDDVVFVDDLPDVLIANTSINEQSASAITLALAARYSAMLKAAVHILLQIRQLHGDAAARRLAESRRAKPTHMS
jgi:hypothetical protein